MKKYACILLLVLAVPLAAAGCATDRYNTQKGAAIGAGVGALYGQAIGRNTESTLLGAALGGLAGTAIGNYHDQRIREKSAFKVPDYAGNMNLTYAPKRRSSDTAKRANTKLITVPGQYINGYYVPPHQAWSQVGQAVVVDR